MAFTLRPSSRERPLKAPPRVASALTLGQATDKPPARVLSSLTLGKAMDTPPPRFLSSLTLGRGLEKPPPRIVSVLLPWASLVLLLVLGSLAAWSVLLAAPGAGAGGRGSGGSGGGGGVFTTLGADDSVTQLLLSFARRQELFPNWLSQWPRHVRAAWHRVPARQMQALPLAVKQCLIAGPVWMPDSRALFSVAVSEASYADFDPSPVQCLYTRSGSGTATGVPIANSRTMAPAEVHQPSEGQAFVYCPRLKSPRETVELSGLPCTPTAATVLQHSRAATASQEESLAVGMTESGIQEVGSPADTAAAAGGGEAAGGEAGGGEAAGGEAAGGEAGGAAGAGEAETGAAGAAATAAGAAVAGPQVSWSSVVYEAIAQPEGVYVWVKGAEFSSAPQTRFCALQCTFHEPTAGDTLTVDPLSCGQEVLLCPYPWKASAPGVGPLRRVSITINGKARPSAAFLDMPREFRMLNSRSLGAGGGRGGDGGEGGGGGGALETLRGSSALRLPSDSSRSRFACACLMVFNVQRFLQEWIPYHRKIGIEKFFVYDNGSKDNTSAVLADLVARGVEISTRHWPWPKTHQSALSHCAIRARSECKWLMFTDVDEFLYPAKVISDSKTDSSGKDPLAQTEPGAVGWTGSGVSPIKALLEEESRSIELAYAQNPARSCHTLGQLVLFPYVFGPAGNKKPPEAGTALGYTCRVNETEPKLQKVFILAEALIPPIMNSIHYWDDLAEVYCYKKIQPTKAAWFHYKYPAWDDYKVKLQRRAPTYTPDLMTTHNMTAVEAIEGLVVELERPDDWEGRFCEVQDTRLASFIRLLFPQDSAGSAGLPWYRQTGAVRVKSKQEQQ